MAANDKQVGGAHYGGGAIQHWDMVAQHGLNYFQGQVTKYVMRAPLKNGKQDLEKARHFLDKYLEVYDLLHPSAKTQYVDADFTIEGYGIDGKVLFKCKHCGVMHLVHTAQDAHQAHGSCAGGGYVGQG